MRTRHLHERAHGAVPERSYAFLLDHLIGAVPDTVVFDREALPALYLYPWTPGTQEGYSWLKSSSAAMQVILYIKSASAFQS